MKNNTYQELLVVVVYDVDLTDENNWEPHIRGYTEKFGLHSVNMSDPERARTAKQSSVYYSQVSELFDIDWIRWGFQSKTFNSSNEGTNVFSFFYNSSWFPSDRCKQWLRRGHWSMLRNMINLRPREKKINLWNLLQKTAINKCLTNKQVTDKQLSIWEI